MMSILKSFRKALIADVLPSELEAEAELPGARVQELPGDNGTDAMTTPAGGINGAAAGSATCSEFLCSHTVHRPTTQPRSNPAF